MHKEQEVVLTNRRQNSHRQQSRWIKEPGTDSNFCDRNAAEAIRKPHRKLPAMQGVGGKHRYRVERLGLIGLGEPQAANFRILLDDAGPRELRVHMLCYHAKCTSTQ